MNICSVQASIEARENQCKKKENERAWGQNFKDRSIFKNKFHSNVDSKIDNKRDLLLRAPIGRGPLVFELRCSKLGYATVYRVTAVKRLKKTLTDPLSLSLYKEAAFVKIINYSVVYF